MGSEHGESGLASLYALDVVYRTFPTDAAAATLSFNSCTIFQLARGSPCGHLGEFPWSFHSVLNDSPPQPPFRVEI